MAEEVHSESFRLVLSPGHGVLEAEVTQMFKDTIERRRRALKADPIK